MDMITLIHYGELTLKGRNRKYFEERLINNIYDKCEGVLHRHRGYLVMDGGNPENLKDIFGISWFANVFSIEKDIDKLKEAIIEKIKDKISSVRTFAVYTKRSDKEFPYTSVEVSEMVGSEIIKYYSKQVDLKNPEFPINIEISDEIYVYLKIIKGLGGLPVGVSGKVLCLLSGGIDSPVAAYLMMKRGCEVHFIHFYSFSTSEAVLKTKIKDLVENLGKYQFKSRLFLIPYHPFHLAVLKKGLRMGYELVLFRRFMAKVSEEIAIDNGYQAIVTGDSLGQVASQTIENLGVLNESVSLPIFQPLISFDKQEIVDLSKKINSYDLSIRPYKDCCSIIAKRPATRVKSNIIKSFEQDINLEKVMDETLKLKKVYDI